MRRKQELRVLCLHGFRTSGRILKMQMRDVMKTCPFVDFVFVDGPHEAKGEAHEIVRRIWNPKEYKYYEWWDRDEETKEYVGVERSIKYLSSVFEERGPFDGILGFSQGGAFAATLCAMRNDLSWLSSVRFGLLFSAFLPRDETLSRAFENMKKHNKKDDFKIWMTCGEKEEEFFHRAIDKENKDSFPNIFGKKSSVSVTHPTGHEFPLLCRDGRDTLSSLKLFLGGIQSVD